jgi:small-conductance mechanosensitive channel
MRWFGFLRNHSIEILVPLVTFLLTMIVGFLARRVLLSALDRWARKTSGRVDDIIVRAIRAPFMIWVLMLAIHLTAQISPMPAKISGLIGKVLLFLLIASFTFVGSRMASEIVRVYGTRMQGALPVTSLSQNLAQLAVIIIGLLILLNSLGISITPLLTALGVGGLAVALGLQDTLANFFAGFYVSLAGYVRLGDYIKLNSGEEGNVTDIGWRSTTLRGPANNLIIIPNSKLAQAIVTNYFLPDKRFSFSVPVSVSYDCDPSRVEAILVEEAKTAVGQVPGLLGEPGPTARLIPGFGSSSLDFSLVCHVAEFSDQFLVQHELRKRILVRFRREDIEMPIPARTVYLRNDKAKSESISSQTAS